LSESFSIDVDIFRIVTSELKLATLGELKTLRSVDDIKDYIEIIDAYSALEKERYEEDEKKRSKK